MRRILIILSAVTILLISSCSQRYITFSKNFNNYVKGKITRAEYDSVLQTFYTIKEKDFKSNNRLKLTGSYVCKEFCEFKNEYDHRTLHFTDSSYLFLSYRFYGPVTNNTLTQVEGTVNRYTTNGNEVIIEYLMHRDYELYNLYKYARLSENGDTLTFYRTENLQRPYKKEGGEKVETYIYYPDLTAFPKVSY